MSDTSPSKPQRINTPWPENPQPHNSGDGDSGNRSSTASLEGQLLSCILKLMGPTISEHLCMPDDHVETQLRKAAASDEGNKLISAFNDFIRAGVLAAARQTDNASKTSPLERKLESNIGPGMDVTDYSGELPNDESEKSLSAIQPRIPLEVQDTELESMIQQQTRAHVFNNMPIRMLEFDADGSNIKLIGRDDIFRILMLRVQPKIASPEFQQAWNNALGLQDLHAMVYKHRSNKMREVVVAAVSKISSYAILSHTWIRESPGDIVFNTWISRSSNRRGWTKVKDFCRVAAQNHEMTLGWIDSVCINKESSSELDESIRSMYKWYRASHICITYLSETQALGDGAHDSWFTRGWTLQELLAPSEIAFYNRHWQTLGTNKDSAIISLITTETNITGDEMEKCHSGHKDRIIISRIFQMASQRQVTREEDSSYALLGLLDVKIPVAYGEGEQSAFRRLFQELLATRKNVLSLFNRQYEEGGSLLPSSLRQYTFRSTILDGEYGMQLEAYTPPKPITVTHLGVRCQWLLLPALTVARGTSNEIYVPKGRYSAQIPSVMISKNGVRIEAVRNLLDARLYGEQNDYVHPLSDVLPISGRQTTFAVPYFTLKGDILLLPEYLIGIYVYTPDRPGTVHSGSKIRILPTSRVVFVQLVNSTGNSREIPIQDLDLHGMQLVTLYL